MIRSVIAAIAAATLLAACVGGSEPKPSPTRVSPKREYVAKAGDCLRAEPSNASVTSADFSRSIKCTAPHAFEVIGTSPVPERFLGGAADPLDVRESLLAPSDLRESVFHRYANATCSEHIWRLLGFDPDSIKSGGTRLSEIGAFPMAGGLTYRHTLSSTALWSTGKRSLICFVEYGGLQEDQETVRSYNLKPVLEKFLGRHFPPERRSCLAQTPDDSVRSTTCVKPHDAEGVFTFDAGLAFGAEAPDISDAYNFTQKLFDHGVKLCEDILPQILGGPIDPELSVWAWFGTHRIFAQSEYFDSGDETNYHPAECQLRPSDPGLVLSPGTTIDRPELEDRGYRADA